MRSAPLVLLAMMFALPAYAQDLERPAHWNVRFDRPAPDSAIYFVSMPPGWHVTTGPAAILYDPSQVASGEYRVESKIYLFPGERQEGFGVFVGGSNLEAEGQSYLYFLIRKDGQYLIKRRSGSETRTLIPWTAHEAIVKHEGQEGTAENVLAVECNGETVDFFVNGQKVNSLSREQLHMDGIVGLRINHALNVHVAELTVTPRG